MASEIVATYHIRCEASAVEGRARAVAVEQSVEMPVEAIEDDQIRDDIVGKVRGITDLGQGLFEVEIALNAKTVGRDAGQLLNMLFGNASILEDVGLVD